MNDFFTWTFLATFAGAVAGTGFVTQWLKGLFTKIPTQILSYVIALVILLATTAATGGLGQAWSVWAMAPFNAVPVSLSANGAHSGIVRMTGGEK